MKECRLFINNTRIKNLKQLAEKFKDDDVLEAYKCGTLMDFLKESYPSEAAALEKKVGKDFKDEELLQAIIDALGLNKSAIEMARKRTQSKELKILEKQADEFFRDENYDSAVQRSEHIEWKFPSQSAVAQRILGLCHLEGRGGVSKNVIIAYQQLQRAADLMNDAAAQVALGRILLNGVDNVVPKNGQKALEYFILALNQGNAEASFQLGLCYEEGRCGLAKDIRKAEEYYKIASKGKCAEASYKLACYYKANGNRFKYMAYLKCAEDQGSRSAKAEKEKNKSDKKWANRILTVATTGVGIILLGVGASFSFRRKPFYRRIFN